MTCYRSNDPDVYCRECGSREFSTQTDRIDIICLGCGTETDIEETEDLLAAGAMIVVED